MRALGTALAWLTGPLIWMLVIFLLGCRGVQPWMP